MPKLACQCGYVFNLSVIPCPEESLLIPDQVFVEALEQAEVATVPASGLLAGLDAASTRILVCPQCDRIHREDPDQQGRYTSYLREGP